MPRLTSALLATVLAMAGSMHTSAQEPTQLYWGDTHLHTSYSFDAYLNQNDSADPATAYRWASGLPVVHPYTGTRVQIGSPLDFLVVSDHAEALGVMPAIMEDRQQLGKLSLWDSIVRWFAIKAIRWGIPNGYGPAIFKDQLPLTLEDWGADPVFDPGNTPISTVLGDMTATATNSWRNTIDAAEEHNEPGRFSAMLGWEWSSIPAGANLHRVIVTPNGREQASQYIPFGSDQNQYPEDLWAWLEVTADNSGSQFIAIPHNSNISKGYMFAETSLRGEPMTEDYVTARMTWEPVVEITQIKGDSETHPDLSPDDPFADFEPYEFYLQQNWQAYRPDIGDFIRPALGRGLQIGQRLGANPYKFGLIGSTDAHTGLSSAEEDNFWGKMAYDSIPENKTGGAVGETRSTGWDMSAAGLAAVWASGNTRQEIFDAMKRREVYATTGPRIAVRVFAGWHFSAADAVVKNLVETGYALGVPMGGELGGKESAKGGVKLLVSAQKDPRGANLDRLQVIKGWVDVQGFSREKVYDVAWSGNRKPLADGSLPPVGNTVDEATTLYTNTIGAAQLATVWEDPDFDPNLAAFYYVRVLQIPTARHSHYDALALGLAGAGDFPVTIQERAYTSPIWYTP